MGILFAFSFHFSFDRSSCCRSVLVSIPRFEMRMLDLLLQMSLGHELQSAISYTSCRQMSSLENRLATSVPILPKFQLAS